MIKDGSIDVPALESTQQEADTRIILHTLYSVQNDNVDRVVINVSDRHHFYFMPFLCSNPPQMPSRAVGENRAKCIPSCPSNDISTGARTVSCTTLYP